MDMKRGFRKPAAFILTLSLIFGAFIAPCYADSSIYSEASLVNGVDTGFEKQSEIAEVKAQSYDGARTLNNDSHSGRFSLKLGKSGLTESLFCSIISSGIDLSRYNQVSLWVKPKGYNIPVTLYTMTEGEQTTIGSIAVTNLKADVWQQVSFDLTTVSGAAMSGLYTYAYNNKSLLIDDISFSKSYYNTDSWDLSANGPSNTLPTEMAYQDGVGITLKTSTTDSAVYQSGAKVASIENLVSGQIADIRIDSSSNTPVSEGAKCIEGITAANQASYSFDSNHRFLYYYDKTAVSLICRDNLTNETEQIYNSLVNFVRTNEDGSKLAFVDESYNLYYVPDLAITDPNNITANAIKITTGAIANLQFVKNDLYFVYNNELYLYTSGKIQKVSNDFLYANGNLYSSNRFTYSKNSESRAVRHDNIYNTDYTISNCQYYVYSISASGNMAICIGTVSSGTSGKDFLINGLSTPNVINLGDTSYLTRYFLGDHLFSYHKTTKIFSVYNCFNSTPKTVNSIIHSMDIDKTTNAIVFTENKGSIYLLNKSFSYDKELLVQFSTTASPTTTPVSNSAVELVKFSTQPNQVIAQMGNGDIYAIDTRTKTSRLIISKMVLHDVLSNGRLLLSDMADTGRFQIYDATTNTKEVFRLDNRNTSSSFTIQFNEDTKTVYYLNNANKMQVLPLTGAETRDKYALVLNNDNKWWVYQNNTWKTIYTGSDNPPAEIMDSMGMTAAEINAITEKEFQKLPENAKPDTLRIAVYFNSNSPYATPVLKSISVSTKDAEADLDGKTAYGTRIKEYNKADFRNVSAIHVTENKDSTDQIFYFLVVDGTPYSIRNGEVCDIDKSATQLFGNVKENYLDIMSYGMNAKELADLPAAALKEILITDNTTDKFGIVAVIKTLNKDTKHVKLDYVLESLQKRFDDSVTTVKILLTDDTLIQYTSGEVTKEEIEKFADWIMDRKYNRGPVFFTFHVGNQYKIINYYMIKMFSVE